MALRIWVGGLALGILAMIAVGGYTRLTHAGLALVDWKPIVGALPPLSVEAWHAEWLRYQEFPEFKSGVVTDFSLFQKLFWIEYAHRLLGRLVGLWALMGWAWGMMSHKWPAWLKHKSWQWCLGLALQGWMGWYMVQSGLIHNPQVSPFRLALHLWVALVLLVSVARSYSRLRYQLWQWQAPWYIQITRFLIGITLTYGALVAGHKAGLIYNTFPLMEGHVIPPDAMFYQPIWINALTNPACIQALHRYLAFLTLLLVSYSTWKVQTPRIRAWCALAYTQASLGIVTLLTSLHLHSALIHQMGGVFLWVWSWGLFIRHAPEEEHR